MKQRITKEQWEEVTKLDHLCFWDEISLQDGCEPFEVDDEYPTPDIGQMIEFLGSGFKQWAVIGNDEGKESVLIMKLEPFEELCDALWEAVKYKLKTNV